MNQIDLSGQRGCRVASARGFTLVELLVTVSIILVLAAVTTIGVRSMKDSAYSATCMSNLKSLSVAAMMASSDNHSRYPAMRVFPWDPDGHLPDTNSGFYTEEKAPSIGEALGPYLGIGEVSTMDIDPDLMPEVFKCITATRNTNMSWINRFGAYRFNYYAIGRPPSTGDAMIFTDTCWNDWDKENFSHQNPAGLNVAYADGRVAFMEYTAYMKINPASSAEKKNRFFTKGWLD